MPVLTVIGGPNGAGKSTHSKELLMHLGIEAFDFDKEFYSIWSRYGFDPHVEQGAFDQARDLYMDRRVSAIRQNQNFAFETNYHTKEILPVINLFRSNGYTTELVFICLKNTGTAIERVKDRVAKGGHPVGEETIKERFKDGLALFDESFHQFDVVSIYMSKQNTVEAIAILEPCKNKVIAHAPIPSTLTPYLPSITRFITKKQH